MATPTAHIEREMKFRLTRPEYRRLSFLLSTLDSEIRELTTTYFDTPKAHLKSKGAALRLRSRGNKHTLELKMAAPDVSAKSSKAMRTHREWETPLTPHRAKDLRARKVNPLSLKNAVVQRTVSLLDNERPELVMVGTLETHRTHIDLDEMSLDLDRASVGGTEFYELEIEAPAEGPAMEWVERVFEHLEVKIRPSQISKASRVWSHWNRQKKTGRRKKVRRPVKNKN